MAKLYITAHRDLARAGNGHIIQIPEDYGVDVGPVDFGAGVAQSAAIPGGMKFIRINADSACSIAFGTNPTATTSNRRLSAGQTEYFPILAGDKVSVISNI